MQCPFCSKEKSTVIESRRLDGAVWRQRMCAFCFKVFVTLEQVTTEKFPWGAIQKKR